MRTRGGVRRIALAVGLLVGAPAVDGAGAVGDFRGGDQARRAVGSDRNHPVPGQRCSRPGLLVGKGAARAGAETTMANFAIRLKLGGAARAGAETTFLEVALKVAGHGAAHVGAETT